MKIDTINILIIIMTIQSGCAHYFRSANSEYFYADVKPLSICFTEGEILIGQDSSLVTSKTRNDTKKKIQDKIRRRYPYMVENCAAEDKYLIVLREWQERVRGDYFILSLGIIPIVAKTKYEVEVFHNEKSVYKAIDEGNAVMSVFLTPFFFLHKSNADTLFDLLNIFMKKANVGDESLAKG
ncbi:hypothetical protein QJS83_10760 [Bdellovibrio sp. 22V]|uniref:hypothetical protein n=1 Tax=Bdellovibrio sp. 22V TaxID=3044166 RepID=UPI0025429BEA|nr:hypothetical protein [Bdellovibrio sp. 22V]WII70941.1 hypothetical protein QJS83_10760 [Bdellovibrio sp. 22V]